MKLRLFVFAGLLLAAPAHAEALKLGDRVRLVAPTIDHSPIVGRIVKADSLRLTLVTSERTRMAPAVERTIDRDALVRIERSGGYQAKTGKYALIGGLLGVAAGTAIGYVAAMGDESAGPLITAPITFGVAGTLVGAACGAAAGGERWTEVPTDSKVGLQLGAPSLPLAVGVRVSF